MSSTEKIAGTVEENNHDAILIIGDCAELQALHSTLLEHGYNCVTIETSERALATIDSQRPSGGVYSAAIVDLESVNHDALEFSRRLKVLVGADCFFPVVMVGNGTRFVEDIGELGSGCDEFLRVPFDSVELRARLQSLLDRRVQLATSMQKQASLERTLKRRRELASLIVHDLRNPLAAIVGNVELLQGCLIESMASDLATQCLDDLDVLGGKVLGMVDVLLDVEELEEGILRPDPVEVELHEFIHERCRSYQSTLSCRKLQLHVEVENELVAHFDQPLIARVVDNLLDNAVRYAPRGGRVMLSANAKNDDLIISVGNSGNAISSSEKNQIFDRYYSIENRGSSARFRRGLGLYFCRLAVDAHGGSIEVESHAMYPACFVLRLPNCASGVRGAARPSD